jgi:protoporphyrinogen/coproporphyrinogen III oxidase
MEKFEVVIIGAGISGLTFGHYCKQRGFSTVILEKTSKVGGLVNSAQLDDFWVELGAHTCFNSYGNIINVMQNIDLINKINLRATKKFQFYKHQQIHSIPSQLHFLELFLNAWKLFSSSKENKTVKDYYQPIVGEKNYRDVFQHAFNAVICQNAQNFPAELLFRKKPQNKQVARSFIFPNGIQTLPNTIAQHLECRFEQNIQSIEYFPRSHAERRNKSEYFEIKTEQNNTFQANYLVIATPVNVAGVLLEQAAPEISTLLKEIPMSTVESFAVKVPKDAIKLKPFAGLIGAEEDFYSVVSRDTLPNEKYRGFTFHFKAERLDEQKKLQNISKTLEISEKQIIAKTNKINNLPTLRPEHKDLINNLEKALQNQPLALLGNYFQGVSLEDCASRSVAEFNRLFSH